MKKLTKEEIFNASKTTSPEEDYIKIGMSTCGIAAGAQDTYDLFVSETQRLGIKISIRKCGCIGMCYAEPLVEVHAAGIPTVTYGKVDKMATMEIIQKHLTHGLLVDDYIFDMPMKK